MKKLLSVILALVMLCTCALAADEYPLGVWYLRQAETAGGATVVQEQREVDATDLPFEFMLNALRLTDGFPVTLFQERTGLPLRTIERELDAAEQRGLLSRDHVAIRPTELGQRFLNDLQELFLADDEN